MPVREFFSTFSTFRTICSLHCVESDILHVTESEAFDEEELNPRERFKKFGHASKARCGRLTYPKKGWNLCCKYTIFLLTWNAGNGDVHVVLKGRIRVIEVALSMQYLEKFSNAWSIAFSGTQNFSILRKDEAWRVNVRIQGCDLNHGYLCGTMEALDVPMADSPVVTFWEGEIVDTKNHTFFTGKWEAKPEDDIRHWTKFPSFSPLLSKVEVDGGRYLDLSNYPCIFMVRWKEQYFVNVGTDCGLTIAGFYYVCFSCSDGSINGFYYDPNS
ncbi:unnamed protein product, partial [Ilex paraguariensis]